MTPTPDRAKIDPYTRPRIDLHIDPSRASACARARMPDSMRFVHAREAEEKAAHNDELAAQHSYEDSMESLKTEEPTRVP